jgi:hypothetical protein
MAVADPEPFFGACDRGTAAIVTSSAAKKPAISDLGTMDNSAREHLGERGIAAPERRRHAVFRRVHPWRPVRFGRLGRHGVRRRIVVAGERRVDGPRQRQRLAVVGRVVAIPQAGDGSAITAAVPSIVRASSMGSVEHPAAAARPCHVRNGGSGAISGQERGTDDRPETGDARNSMIVMVSPVGLEPTAPRLKVSCSTN